MEAVEYSDSDYNEDPVEIDDDIHESDVPEPLQIVKRVDPRDLDGTAGEPTIRSCSTGTSESLDSAPEPPGADQPLTVPKRRVNRSVDGLGSPAQNGGVRVMQAFPDGHSYAGPSYNP
jgi:hypothetical protein